MIERTNGDRERHRRNEEEEEEKEAWNSGRRRGRRKGVLHWEMGNEKRRDI